TEQDNENSLPVALISERVADTLWPNENPVGRRIRSAMDAAKMDDPIMEKWMTIIGVVGDVRHAGLESRASAELYVPYTQRPRRSGDMSIVMRTSGDAVALASAARNEVRAMSRNVPVDFEPMERVFDRSVSSRRYNMRLLGAF